MYNGCLYASVCLTKDCSCRLDSHIEIDQNVWNKLKSEMYAEYDVYYPNSDDIEWEDEEWEIED